MIIRYVRISANISYFVFLEGDALIEGLGAFVAFWEEVEADATDVFLSAEVFGIVDLHAFDFEFHQSPVLQSYLVAFTQMAVDDFSQSRCGSNEYPLA